MFTLLSAILGAILRRALGGAVKLPRGVTMSALCLLAGVISYFELGLLGATLIAISTLVYWSMGHGSYMDMGTIDAIDNERFAPWLDKWFGTTSTKSVARDYAGMFLRYTVPAIPIAIAYLAFSPSYIGLTFPLVGFVIATSYLITSVFKDYLYLTKHWFDGFTSYGELLAGATFYGALAYICF